jgi:hypothetical protein
MVKDSKGTTEPREDTGQGILVLYWTYFCAFFAPSWVPVSLTSSCAYSFTAASQMVSALGPGSLSKQVAFPVVTLGWPG